MMVDERLEKRLDYITDEPKRRGIVKNMLKYVVIHAPIVGRFYSNSTTNKPKEQDNDYEPGQKYGDSGVA